MPPTCVPHWRAVGAAVLNHLGGSPDSLITRPSTCCLRERFYTMTGYDLVSTHTLLGRRAWALANFRRKQSFRLHQKTDPAFAWPQMSKASRLPLSKSIEAADQSAIAGLSRTEYETHKPSGAGRILHEIVWTLREFESKHGLTAWASREPHEVSAWSRTHGCVGLRARWHFQIRLSSGSVLGVPPQNLSATVQRPRLQYSLPVQFFSYIPRRGLVCSGRARHKSWSIMTQMPAVTYCSKAMSRASPGSADNGISFSGGYWKGLSNMFGHWEPNLFALGQVIPELAVPGAWGPRCVLPTHLPTCQLRLVSNLGWKGGLDECTGST